MNRTTLPLLLLVSLSVVAAATTIQRRAPDEAASAENAPGEITYSLESGGAVLRVGTSDAGTVVASDPWALHVAPRRLLGPREYALTLSPGAEMLADGRVCLASNVTEAVGSVTASVTLRAADPAVRLASVRWGVEQEGASMTRTLTESEATIECTTVYRSFMGRPIPGHCFVVRIEAWAWASDRRDETWDATVADLPLRDSMGEITVGTIRKWVVDFFSGRTAEHWASFPATNDVRLAGHTLWHTSAIRSVAASNALSLVVSGAPVLTVTGPEDAGPTNALRIVDIKMDDGVATLWATAALGAPLRVQSCDDIGARDWRDEDGAASSYPSTENVKGVPCIRLDVPVDDADQRRFYRVVATLGAAEQRTVRIEPGAALYIGGLKAVRENWTFTLTNDTQITRTVLVLEEPQP